MDESGRGTGDDHGRETKDAAAAASSSSGKKVPLFSLFRYADRLDVLLMVVGTVGALGNGISQPLMTVLFGNVINSFGANTSGSVLRSVTKVSARGRLVIRDGDTPAGSQINFGSSFSSRLSSTSYIWELELQ